MRNRGVTTFVRTGVVVLRDLWRMQVRRVCVMACVAVARGEVPAGVRCVGGWLIMPMQSHGHSTRRGILC
jgi:hypothetical protein